MGIDFYKQCQQLAPQVNATLNHLKGGKFWSNYTDSIANRGKVSLISTGNHQDRWKVVLEMCPRDGN